MGYFETLKNYCTVQQTDMGNTLDLTIRCEEVSSPLKNDLLFATF